MSIKSKSGDYYIERLSESNLAGLENLFTAVYNRPPATNLFASKYNTAFTAVIYTAYIAYNNQQVPIAYYGVIPCFIRFEDKIVLSAQSADTMTHPEYRNKGLFVELAEMTYELCRSAGMPFIFGFPNQNSLPGFLNKLEWKTTERLDCFLIPVSIFPWRRGLKKVPVLKKIFNKRATELLKISTQPQQGIDNSVFKDGYAGIYRDYQYLKYKTYYTTHVIRIGTSTAWVKINNELLIGDLSVSPENFDMVMRQLKKLSRKLGLAEIHFHASPGTTLHTLFSGSFYSIPSFPVIFKDFAGSTPINKIKFTAADIDTF